MCLLGGSTCAYWEAAHVRIPIATNVLQLCHDQLWGIWLLQHIWMQHSIWSQYGYMVVEINTAAGCCIPAGRRIVAGCSTAAANMVAGRSMAA